MSLTQKNLIDAITEELGAAGTSVSKTQVEAVLDQLAIITRRSLSASIDVPLPGIGKLKPGLRAARSGHNPQTGEVIDIPAKHVVKLSVAKALDDALNP
jgi:DNA-binding protein HU-beta